MLDGLLDVDWAALRHGEGSAADIPYVLRRMASADADEAERARWKLGDATLMAGLVYPAAAAAIPFLVELATTAPHHRAEILDMVATAADTDHVEDLTLPETLTACRAALAACAGRVASLLADPDPAVRAAAARAVTQCGDAVPAAVLWDRWAVEESGPVREALLVALGERDPERAAPSVDAALAGPDRPMRMAALRAIHRSKRAWPAGAAAVLVEAAEAEEEVWGGRLFLIVRSTPDEAFVSEVLTTLLRSGDSGVRAVALGALGGRFRYRRGAPERLLPLLRPLLADPDPRVRAQLDFAVRSAGPVGAALRMELPSPPAMWSQVPPAYLPDDTWVLPGTLAALGDPRWPEILARFSADAPEPSLADGVPEFRPDALEAVRQQLRALTRAARTPPSDGPARAMSPLVRVLLDWERPALARDELRTAALYLDPATLRDLGAAGVLDEAELRTLAAEGDGTAWVTLARLSDDPGPLVAEIRRRLDEEEPDRWSDILGPARAVGDRLADAVPTLSRLLVPDFGAPFWHGYARLEAAEIVWRATGRSTEVRPVVAAGLLSMHDGAAALLVGRMRDASLGPALREQLPREGHQTEVAWALWRLGAPVAELAPVLLRVIERQAGRFGAHSTYGAFRAVELLVDMGAADALPALRELAERDRRLGSGRGLLPDETWRDERIRAELRSAIAALGGDPVARTAPPGG